MRRPVRVLFCVYAKLSYFYEAKRHKDIGLRIAFSCRREYTEYMEVSNN